MSQPPASDSARRSGEPADKQDGDRAVPEPNSDAEGLEPTSEVAIEPLGNESLFSGEVPLPSTRSMVGEHFHDFELLQELGRGGMGVVYKARQLSLDRLVAIKMLLGEHLRNPVALTRFVTEARAAAALTHPNIVAIYQVGECAAGPYFVMEYIDGVSLEQLLEKGPLPIAAAVSSLITVAEAVHYAHGKGVIHRDLKPANIMIDRLRRPVVMDFGIAKVLGKPATVTQDRVVLGTPAYMAPEQAGDNRPLMGPSMDVYALGAILYTVLAGRPPYEGETPLQVVFKVVSREMPEPVRSFRPEVSPALEQVIKQCLGKHPSDRFPSAHALAEELRRLRAGGLLIKAASDRSLRAGLPRVYLVADKSGAKVRLKKPVNLIGRGADCDIVLRVSDVSKRHCQVSIEEGEVIVEDLASANGINVNGEPVERAELRDHDWLEIAGHAFEVRIKRPKG